MRLRGDSFPRDLVLETYDLVLESPDVGSVKMRVPAALALGVSTVELSVDGTEWIKSAAATSTCHVFGVLQVLSDWEILKC